jgi:sugar lactone lactonase YvrE
MKTKLTETRFKSNLGVAGRLVSKIAYLGAVILICATASAQNLFVSGFGCCSCETLNNTSCGQIFEFSWDGVQTTFAPGLTAPGDVAFDNAGNLFVVDQDTSGRGGDAVIYKITPNGARTTLASGLSYPSYLAVNRYGDVFVADYNKGMIYIYKPNGARTTFVSGLHHPVGLVFDTAGNLFVAANNIIGNIPQGSIYEYKPDGSRATFAVLEPSDRPADLVFDNMGNLFMADLGGNIYKYEVLRRNTRTTFGSVPNSAQSMAFDSSGNLFVVDKGDVNGNGNMIYKFTTQAVRTPFAAGHTLYETFGYLAFPPPACCQ